ncbi:hypothetical protein ACIQU4_28685 [Streptomyces sp. NPDC090741]|uniref:hypothetical protein n=1 Tax=Streptomyces sp. NPDC090741 TaxID=3365967 RepID=UPI003823FA66
MGAPTRSQLGRAPCRAPPVAPRPLTEPRLETPLTITSADTAAAAARRLDHRVGPLAELAVGDLPACFARLRIQLGRLTGDAHSTYALLDMPDGPDDALWERGKNEMIALAHGLGELHAWVSAQDCLLERCDCRADRLLRQLLREARVPECIGHSPKLGRATSVIAGHFEPDLGGRYVLVDYRNNIEHAVRFHGGWRARLVTDAGVYPLYTSHEYPHTPLGGFDRDTRACVDAVAAALGR